MKFSLEDLDAPLAELALVKGGMFGFRAAAHDQRGSRLNTEAHG